MLPTILTLITIKRNTTGLKKTVMSHFPFQKFKIISCNSIYQHPLTKCIHIMSGLTVEKD